MTVTQLVAHTDGGNLEVTLPNDAANLRAEASTGGGNVNVIGRKMINTSVLNTHSGAGNVAVHVPEGMPASVHPSSGLGKMLVEPRFTKIDAETYDSPDYDAGINRLDITVTSGAGNLFG